MLGSVYGELRAEIYFFAWICVSSICLQEKVYRTQSFAAQSLFFPLSGDIYEAIRGDVCVQEVLIFLSAFSGFPYVFAKKYTVLNLYFWALYVAIRGDVCALKT